MHSSDLIKPKPKPRPKQTGMQSSDDVKALFRSGVKKMNEGSFMDAKVDLLVASKMDDKNTNIKKALAKLVRLENAAKAKDRAAAKEHAKDDEIAAVIMASVKGWSDKGSEVPELVQKGVFNALLESGISKMNTGSLVEASIDLTAALTLDPRNEDVLKALKTSKRNKRSKTYIVHSYTWQMCLLSRNASVHWPCASFRFKFYFYIRFQNRGKVRVQN